MVLFSPVWFCQRYKIAVSLALSLLLLAPALDISCLSLAASPAVKPPASSDNSAKSAKSSKPSPKPSSAAGVSPLLTAGPAAASIIKHLNQPVTLLKPTGWEEPKLAPYLALLSQLGAVVQILPQEELAAVPRQSVLLVPLAAPPTEEDLAQYQAQADQGQGVVFFEVPSSGEVLSTTVRGFVPLFKTLGLMGESANNAPAQWVPYKGGRWVVLSDKAAWLQWSWGLKSPEGQPISITPLALKLPPKVLSKSVIKPLPTPKSVSQAGPTPKPTPKPLEKAVVKPSVKPTPAVASKPGAKPSVKPEPLVLPPPLDSEALLLKDALKRLFARQPNAQQWAQAQQQQAVTQRTYAARQREGLLKYRNLFWEAYDLADRLDLTAENKLNKPRSLEALHRAETLQSQFDAAFDNERFEEAARIYPAVQKAYVNAWLLIYPSQAVQGRAVWLDRGTIVRSGSPEALRALLAKFRRAGFNLVFVESINAGFSVYPSKVLPKRNPLTLTWDPLAVAVEEGHKLGMEVHAWVWCFAVGNTRHNAVLGLSEDYRGPILSDPRYQKLALRLNKGLLVPYDQHEYWLSPASPDSHQLLLNAYKEIITHYPVDGLQLDYIRFPFQKPNMRAGFDPITKGLFEAQTGYTLTEGDMSAEVYNAWVRWKTQQVTRFVEKVATELKPLRPGLKLSAAVFPLPREARLNAIQQDWETWIANGWLDTLSPMTYTTSPGQLAQELAYIQKISLKGTLIYPGLGLHNLGTEQLLEQMQVIRKAGGAGSTVFAAAYLNEDVLNVLKQGPYHQLDAQIPHRRALIRLQEELLRFRAALKAIAGPLQATFASLPEVTAAQGEANALQMAMPPPNPLKSPPEDPLKEAQMKEDGSEETQESSLPPLTDPVTALGSLIRQLDSLVLASSVSSQEKAALSTQSKVLFSQLRVYINTEYGYNQFISDFLQGELRRLQTLAAYAIRHADEPLKSSAQPAVGQPVEGVASKPAI